jgi:hypothetical protein
MIEYSEHDSKRSFTQLFNNFIAVVNMVIVTDVVLLLVGVEAMISGLIKSSPLTATGKTLLLPFPFLAFLNVEIVNSLVFCDFFFFIVR